MSGGSSGSGPCGACKFLRRKCVKGCVFAPYFDSDQGTAQFAAVHKVFGASNASKLLLRIPPHKRLEAVVTLCYEALARATDPVYGCVGHIFTLQQQVVNLQAELAFTQARLSTLQRLPPPLPLVPPQRPQSLSPTSFHSSLELPLNTSTNAAMMHFDPFQSHQMSSEMTSVCELIDQELEDDGDDLQALAREFVARYLQGVRFRPPPASPH